MTETIITALITGGLTLLGVLISNSRSQAVTETKLEELTREVREHIYWVYKHTFPNGKCYVGITMQYPIERWKNGRGYSYNKHFDRAVKKYGWDNVEHEILAAYVSKQEACELEQHYIELYQSADPKYGYNQSTGGEHGGSGCVPSATSREKRSFAMKGRMVGRYVGEKSARAKKIAQYTKDGDFVAKFGATTDAQRETGIHYTGIVKCCTHNQNTAGGYIWLYVGDEEYLPTVVAECNKIRHPSEETKKRTSESMKAYWASKEASSID